MQLSEEPLIDARAIAARVMELGREVSRDFAEGDLVIVPVLKGGAVFAADLMRRLTVPVRVEYVSARSYEGTASTGSVSLSMPPAEAVAGKNVLIVEDILDTGRTTSDILARMQVHEPARVALCVLLNKPGRREVEVCADYVGFTIEDVFVVGYGLDYEERYRELPSVHVIEEV